MGNLSYALIQQVPVGFNIEFRPTVVEVAAIDESEEATKDVADDTELKVILTSVATSLVYCRRTRAFVTCEIESEYAIKKAAGKGKTTLYSLLSWSIDF